MKMFSLSVFLLVAAFPLLGTSADLEPGFVPLFDGKTLAGWEGKPQVFRVEEGAIVAGSATERVPQNEFLATEKKYENFELRLDAKLVGKGDNAGIQFRSERIPNHHEVIGYQCDMGFAGPRPIWGSLYDESRRKDFLAHGDAVAVGKALKKEDWNSFVIRCEGPHIQIWLNGVATVDYTEKDAKIARTGIIALQIHGGEPAVASYRNVRIKELPATK